MNVSPIVTQIYDENDRQELKSFFKDVYSPNHILLNDDYFVWQFKNDYSTLYKGFSNLICFQNYDLQTGIKNIVGHVGLIPASFKIFNEKRRASFLSCFVFKKEFQSIAGPFLLKQTEKWLADIKGNPENNPEILYTTGANNLMSNLLKALDWTDAGNLHRWTIKEPRTSYEHKCEPALDFSEDDKKQWNLSWNSLKNRYKITIDRTYEYLKWRFFKHPFIAYKIFVLREEKDFHGYIIGRYEQGEKKAIRIVDFIAKNEQVEQELLKSMLNLAQAYQVDFLDFFCSSKMYAKSLKDLGFNDSDSETPVFILPVDNTRKSINWAYKIINPELNIKQEDWFIVKADGDKDRPQNI